MAPRPWPKANSAPRPQTPKRCTTPMSTAKACPRRWRWGMNRQSVANGKPAGNDTLEGHFRAARRARRLRRARAVLGCVLAAAALLAAVTWASLRDFPEDLNSLTG